MLFGWIVLGIILKTENSKMRSFGPVRVKGKIVVHKLWWTHWVQFRKIYYIYSKSVEVYCLVFRFHFPNYKAKYRLNCHISYDDVLRPRISSNVFYIPSKEVPNIIPVMCQCNIAKTSSILLRYDTMGAADFGDKQHGSQCCYWKTWN